MSEKISLLEMIEKRITAGDIALPARHRVAHQLQNLLSRKDYEISDLLEIVESDQALTAEMLRLANSPFFGGLASITTVRTAVVRTGPAEVVRIAIAASDKESYQVRHPRLAAVMAPLWDHAMGVAIGARWLATRLGYHGQEDEAFIGGLLHDVGKLLLVRICDDLVNENEISPDISTELITEVMRAGHGAHGAALMRQWALPQSYQDIALHHHDPDIAGADTLLLLVRLANHACRALGIGLNHDPSLTLAATQEAFALDAREVLLAELSIKLEDSFALV